MSRTKTYVTGKRPGLSPRRPPSDFASTRRILQRVPAAPAAKALPSRPQLASAARKNLAAESIAAVLVPAGQAAAQGTLHIVGAGAVCDPGPGHFVAGFIHADGSAVKFLPDGGGVHLAPALAAAEFHEWVRPARRMLSGSPPTAPARPLHRKADTGLADGDTGAVDRALQTSRGGALPSRSRARLESAFDADLSAVRVHTDAAADLAARSVQAQAFTTGRDVFFRAGHYQPETLSGGHLLAHEVAHTIQQGGQQAGMARLPETGGWPVSAPADALEREAEQAADAAVHGRRTSRRLMPTGLAALPISRRVDGSLLASTATVLPFPAIRKKPGAPAGEPAPRQAAAPPSSDAPQTLGEKPSVTPASQQPAGEPPRAGAPAEAAASAGPPVRPAAHGEPPQPGPGTAKPGPAERDEAAAGSRGVDGGQQPTPGPAAARPVEGARLQAVVEQVREAASQQKTHPPAAAKAAEASAAANGPPNEVAALAGARQVGVMDQQEGRPFDRAGFLETLLSRIEAITPQTLEEADEFKKTGQAGALKEELTQQVGQRKELAQGNVAAAVEAEPNPAGIEPKSAAPLASAPPAPPPAVAVAGATPPLAADQAVSLAEDSRQLDDQMASAKITREQLEKSNEPAFQQAVVAKDAAQTHAEQAPQDYRSVEQATLDAARAENETAVAKQLAEMAGVRGQALGTVLGKQTAAQGEDEAKRAAVAKGIQEIYEQTRKDVADRLARLDTEVNAAFDAAAQRAQQEFEDHVAARMARFKDERYAGPAGALLWLKDKFLGLPPEVNDFYVEGKQKYIAAMRAAMEGIATLVEQGITEAKARISAGKKRVEQYVNGQPKELQAIARQAAGNILAQFDQLEQGVDDKQNQIVDGLVTRYQENLKTLDDKIAAMKAENGGLISAALAVIGDVIETIREFKDLLLRVLAKAADVIELIISDPIGFLANLVAAVKQGVTNFVANIATHLQTGFFEWLFGTLAAAGLQLPKQFDLKGVLGLVLQVLGLTYANIRARAVKIVGEKVVKTIETASEIFVKLATEGPAGLWEYIKEQAGSLLTSLIDGIKSFLIDKVIVGGVTWLIGLLNPASAFIKACKAIYDIVMFFIERGQQILALVNAILDSVTAIAKGSLAAAAKFVEDALAKAIPVAIGFLASLLGLGGLSDRIKALIENIQAPVNAAIDWVIKKAVRMVKALGKLLGTGTEHEKREQGADARTPEEKQNDLKQALVEAGALLNTEHVTHRAVVSKLPEVRSRYRLTSLELVVDEKKGGEELVHVRAAVNPTGESQRKRVAAELDIEAETDRIIVLIEHGPGGGGDPSKGQSEELYAREAQKGQVLTQLSSLSVRVNRAILLSYLDRIIGLASGDPGLATAAANAKSCVENKLSQAEQARGGDKIFAVLRAAQAEVNDLLKSDAVQISLGKTTSLQTHHQEMVSKHPGTFPGEFRRRVRFPKEYRAGIEKWVRDHANLAEKEREAKRAELVQLTRQQLLESKLERKGLTYDEPLEEVDMIVTTASAHSLVHKKESTEERTSYEPRFSD